MKKSYIKIIVISGLAAIAYIGLIYLFQEFYVNGKSDESVKYNEFGDFVGGLLNPLFTLLSTIAIVYLTIVVAKSDNMKAEKAIETQKRLTLNQMRQTSFDNIVQKLNLYVFDIDKIKIHEVENRFHQAILTNMIKEKQQGKSRVAVWLIILNELENFTQLNYLFYDLFRTEIFQTKHTELIEITSSLCQQQDEFHFIKKDTIKNYIDAQQEFLTIIGNYIYSEF